MARRLAREAVSAIDGDMCVLPDISESLESQFAWICISLRVPVDALAANHTHHRFQTARALRESLGVLTLLAACKGFGLQENTAFWSDVLPEGPPLGSVASWARGNWSERRTRPQPCAALQHPCFRFVIDERGPTAAATSASSATYLLSVLEMLASMVGSKQPPQTPAFEEALLALRPWVLRERLAQKIECGVDVRDLGADRVSRLLQARVGDAGLTLTRGCGAAATPGEVFTVPPVCVETIFYSMLHCDKQHQALTSLKQLMSIRAAMQLDEVYLRIGEKRQRVPDMQTLDALRALLWEIYHDDSLASTKIARWRFELRNASVVAAVCSAFPSMTNAHRLHLTFAKSDSGNVDERSKPTQTWKWLAATLFHPSSTSGVQALTLESCRLTMDDVAAIEAVLDSDWDETMMGLEVSKQDLPLLPASIRKAPSSDASAPGRSKVLFASAKRGTRVEPEPIHRLFDSPLVTLVRQRSFPVLRASPSWICIQLPGYGCGYVARTSVLSYKEHDYGQRGLTALNIEVDEADAAVALLRLVGGPLQHLALKSNTFRRNHLVKLIECCPGLTSLRLGSTQLDDFSDLIGGRCAITSLEVNTPTISGACIQQLSSTLSDRDRAERCPLRELRLGTGRLASQELEELLGMLDANRTLKFLHIRIAFDLFDSFFPRFQAHQGDRIRDQAESKRAVAFLSAIGYYSESSSPMKNADPAIIASILSFAGTGTRAISVDENTDGMSLEQIVARSQRNQVT